MLKIIHNKSVCFLKTFHWLAVKSLSVIQTNTFRSLSYMWCETQLLIGWCTQDNSTPDKLFVSSVGGPSKCHLKKQNLVFAQVHQARQKWLLWKVQIFYIYDKPIIMTYLSDKQIVRPSGCMVECHLQGLWPFRWHTTMHPSGLTICLSLRKVMIMSVCQYNWQTLCHYSHKNCNLIRSCLKVWTNEKASYKNC